MIWIIPMAGKGTRTQELGEFKPFIEIKGSKIFSWFMCSIKHLVKPEDSFQLITTKYFTDKYNFEAEIKKIFEHHNLKNSVTFTVCDGSQQGSSATVLLVKDKINLNEPIIVIFPDQFIDFVLPEIIPNSAYMGVYVQLGNKSGFVNIVDGLVTNFIEKQNISNLASSGVYITSSGKDLIEALEKQIEEGVMLNGEFYIGPAFNYLIKSGIKTYPIPIIAKYDLGNTKDVEYFSDRPFVC